MAFFVKRKHRKIHCTSLEKGILLEPEIGNYEVGFIRFTNVTFKLGSYQEGKLEE